MASPVGKPVSELPGKRALIIGGTSCIGLVWQRLLSRTVPPRSSSPRPLQIKISSALERLHSSKTSATKAQIQSFPCNLASPDTLNSEVDNLFAQVAKEGKLDHVVFPTGDQLTVGKLEEFKLNMIRQAAVISRVQHSFPYENPE